MTYALATAAAAQLSLAALRLTKTLYRRYLRTPIDPTSYGSWALITGCTDGIGKAYARELAKKGTDSLAGTADNVNAVESGNVVGGS